MNSKWEGYQKTWIKWLLLGKWFLLKRMKLNCGMSIKAKEGRSKMILRQKCKFLAFLAVFGQFTAISLKVNFERSWS